MTTLIEILGFFLILFVLLGIITATLRKSYQQEEAKVQVKELLAAGKIEATPEQVAKMEAKALFDIVARDNNLRTETR